MAQALFVSDVRGSSAGPESINFVPDHQLHLHTSELDDDTYIDHISHPFPLHASHHVRGTPGLAIHLGRNAAQSFLCHRCQCELLRTSLGPSNVQLSDIRSCVGYESRCPRCRRWYWSAAFPPPEAQPKSQRARSLRYRRQPRCCGRYLPHQHQEHSGSFDWILVKGQKLSK